MAKESRDATRGSPVVSDSAGFAGAVAAFVLVRPGVGELLRIGREALRRRC